MPTLRELLKSVPTDDPADALELVKVQCDVPLSHKRRVLAALGDDGAYAFLIRHAFLHAYRFAKQHDIQSYDPSKHAAFVEYIASGFNSKLHLDRADSRSDRPAAVVNVSRGVAYLQRSDAPTPSESGSAGQSRPRRKRGDDKENKEGRRTDKHT